MKKAILLLGLLLSTSFLFILNAQEGEKPDLFPVNGEVFHIDSLPYVTIDEIIIETKPTLKHRRKIRRYNKLVRKVKKVYPYAKLANAKIVQIENTLATIDGEKAKKDFVKQEEDKLMLQFERKLKKLTFSEGRILIKLIDRQTGKTSYELIKQLRGKFSAFLWQGVARLFGSNLKSEYDPEEEDIMIENIIVRIENNEL